MVNLRTLTIDDTRQALELSNAEKWNQTAADWNFIITTPENVCLAAVDNEKVVGTATAIVYNNEVAWIGMVLVNKNYRGKGISKLLLSDLFEKLKYCCCIKLDATPAGRPVYEKFGFKTEYKILRLTNASVSLNNLSYDYSCNIERLCSEDISKVISFDENVFGANRAELIAFLYKNNTEDSWVLKQDGKNTGFVLGREGIRFYQLGPVAAMSGSGAKELLLKSFENIEGKAVVIDVPYENKDLLVWLLFLGFEIQRSFFRMYQHENLYPGIPQNQISICGPEFG